MTLEESYAFCERVARTQAKNFYYSFLLLPYSPLETVLKASVFEHVWPMAWMIWAVLAYRRPAVAGAFLGVASATVFFPVLVVPVWLGFYWQRGALRFALSFLLTAGLCLGLLGLAIWRGAQVMKAAA